jgi:uncharacterized membrane protein YqiK
MATKSPVTEIQESTPLAEIAKRPDTLKLFGHAHEVLDEYTIHARSGYRLFPGMHPTYYEQSGMMSILLQLGDPMPLASQRAAETIAREQREEGILFERRVKEEAARLHAAQIQADQEARIAAAEALANAAVEKIKADVAAERARIEAVAQQ